MIAWLFHSPARFLACIAAALTIVAIPFALGSHTNQPEAGRPSALPTALPTLDTDQAKRAAVEFVNLWCALGERTPEQWVAEMKARSSPELGSFWSVNQTANLSGDCYWGHTDTRWIQPTAALYALDTKRGRPVLVRMEQVGARVLVADITDDSVGGD